MNSQLTNTPFDYLRRKNGEEYSPEIRINWCKAREYVLDRLEGTFFCPNDSGHLHVMVAGDSPLMLSVVRQLALSAHYANYVEYDVSSTLVCKNRTVITLKSQNDHIVEELKKEGIQKIFGLVFKDNEAANAFWERQGYSLRTNLNYRNKSLNEAIPTGK